MPRNNIRELCMQISLRSACCVVPAVWLLLSASCVKERHEKLLTFLPYELQALCYNWRVAKRYFHVCWLAQSNIWDLAAVNTLFVDHGHTYLHR